MNDAGVAPPGVMPIQQPTRHPRSDVSQYRGSSAQVFSTTLASILPLLRLKDRPSSMVRKISPSPNKPMTATRKSKPCKRVGEPNVMRSVPVTVSMPTAASAKPSIIEAIVLTGGSRPMPTKLQEGRSWIAKNSGGTNFSANLATSGARKVIRMIANSAPMNDEVNAAVSASPARPFCAIGEPPNRGAAPHRAPGGFDRNDGEAPPHSAA